MSMVRRASLPVANNASRREGLRTKTPSVNELSKKFKNTPKGKRRLEFQSKQPLKDKKFYLDLNGYKKVLSLSARITELGGKVEEFFSKDITYLITNRKEADSRLSPRSNSTPSPGISIPSPFPMNKSSSIKGSAWPSPLSADSPQSIDAHQTAPKHDTRGKTLRKQATLSATGKFGTSDILTNARTWDINVIYLEKILEKLAEYGPSKVEKQPSIKELKGSGKKELKVKIRKLQVPFIKVEDQSHYYKPLVKEFKEWPLPIFDSPVGTCPFDSPKKKKNSEQKRKNKEKDNQNVKKQTKKGYCECCCMHYDALDSHLRSDQHKEFAQNDSNYVNLDQLIKGGPSLRVFLEKIKQNHSKTGGLTKPFSESTLDDPFLTPNKEPKSSTDINIEQEDIENTKEKLTKDNNKMTKQNDKNDCVEDKTPDKKHMGELSGRNEISQENKCTEEEFCEGTRRLTRSQLSYKNDSNSCKNIELKVDEMKNNSSTQNFSHKQKKSVPLSNKNYEGIECKVELQHCNLAEFAVVSTQGKTDSDEKVKEHKDEEESTESLLLREPAIAISSIVYRKSQKTADCDGNEENKRVLRSQRKSNCSSDSTETLTGYETLTHSPANRNYRGKNVSTTDSIPELSNTAGGSQVNDKQGMLNDDSKVCRSKEHGLTATNSFETQDVEKTQVSGKVFVGIQESLCSPESGLRCDSTHHGTLTTWEEEDSGASSKPNAGSKNFISNNVTPSTWSNLPNNSEKGAVISTVIIDESPKGNGNVNTCIAADYDRRCDSESAQDFNEMTKANNTTITSLFDSDDDDDKSFLGFDVPHFVGSSSEPDLQYRIKKIVEYFTESQDDTLVNTTDDEVEEEGKSGTTGVSEIRIRKKKRQPHGIKIILSSTTENDDDNVFRDEDEDEDKSSDNDTSSSTVADSTDGEDDELSSASVLCMDSFTYKRKSCNLDDDKLDLQLPQKRRRTNTDEDRSAHSEETRRKGDKDGCDVETRRSTRSSTKMSSTTSMEDDYREDCGRERRTKFRVSTRISNSTKEITNHVNHLPQKERNQKTRRNTRAKRNSKTGGKAAGDDCSINIEDASEKDTRATKNSSTEERKVDLDYELKMEEEARKGRTRFKTRASKRTLQCKENILGDVKDTAENRGTRSSTRASTGMLNSKMVVDHRENCVPKYQSLKRVTRSQGELTRDLMTVKNHKIENKSGKENTKEEPTDNEVLSNKKRNAILANNDSLSSVGEISCTSYSSFLDDLPPKISESSSVHITIEEKVKLRNRNRINSETPAHRSSTNEKVGDQKVKDCSQMINDSTKTSRKTACSLKEATTARDEVITHTNMDEVGSKARLRFHSLDQKLGKSKHLSKTPSKAMSSVEVPFQRKALCSTPSSRDSSPFTTPLRMQKHWIFDPGHFSSSSTPQLSRKVKSRTSPPVDNKPMTARALRNTCLVSGDSYEFIGEDVYAFDD